MKEEEKKVECVNSSTKKNGEDDGMMAGLEGLKKKEQQCDVIPWDCVFFPFFFVASSCFLLLLASFPITEEPVHIYPRCEVHIPLVFR